MSITNTSGSQPFMSQEEASKKFEEIKQDLLINEQVSTVKQAKTQAAKIIKQEQKNAAQAVKDAELQARINRYSALGVNVNPNTGYPETSFDNYVHLLENAKMHFKPFRYNEFTDQTMYGDEPMSDALLTAIMFKASELCKFEMKKKIEDAILYAGNNHKYHELKDYLNSLKWDNKRRIETMFHDYLGAVDCKLYGTMAKLWMIAAVDRVFRPGCKFDNIIIFAGPQGVGKSTFCERLAVNPNWYCEDIQIGDKDGYQQLQTSWIINMDEITSLNKKDAATAKNFLTKTHDKYRNPYGHYPENHPRHCIFVGTTNEDSFLKDSTAVTERRYWVVRCSGSRSAAIERIEKLTPEVVDQLWAEAMVYYNYMIDEARKKANGDDRNIKLKLYIPDSLWNEFVADQIQYKTEKDSELFEFLDDALNRKYDSFMDDSSLSRQYSGQASVSAQAKKQDIFTVNSINRLLSDNKIFTWKGCLKQYAAMHNDMWEYKTVRVKDRTAKALRRVETPDTEADITKPEDNLFEL